MKHITTLMSKIAVTTLFLVLLGTLSFYFFNEITEMKKTGKIMDSEDPSNTTDITAKTSHTSPAANISPEANVSNNASKSSSNPSGSNPPQTQAPATDPFQEGKHYKKLTAKITTEPLIQGFIATDPNKIQVIEFFNYGCFWCERIHTKVNDWVLKKPDNVVFYRFPIVFNKAWEVLAKAYFMVDMLGKHEPLDMIFFKAVNKDNIDLSNEKKLQEFFIQHGIDEQKFKELYHSFTVNNALTQTNAIANAYQITASPAFILNMPSGIYLVTASLAGTEQAVLTVVNYLLQKEMAAMQDKTH